MKRYKVTIDRQKDLPDPKEPVDLTYDVPGSFLGASREVGPDFLADGISSRVKIRTLIRLIEELDKGEGGKFNLQYFIEADQKSPDLTIVDSFKNKFTSLDFGLDSTKAIFSTLMRDYLRKMAFRFYCYLKIGYIIRFEVVNS